MRPSAFAAAAALLFLPVVVQAGLITIEPDRFASGTDLSAVSAFASLRTGAGGSVYSTELFPRWGDPRPGDLLRNGRLQRRVFSGTANDNTEWYALPWQYDMAVFDPTLWAIDAPEALIITFNAPVNFVSILGAEIIGDAGCCTDDPIRAWLYDSQDRLIVSTGAFPAVGHLGAANYEDSGFPGYPVFRGDFSFPDIHRIVLGGESEPTTFDRLRFRTINVPEPAPLGLLSISLLGLAAAHRRQRSGDPLRRVSSINSGG